MEPKTIVLLDLNFTFVSNSSAMSYPSPNYAKEIEGETYREGLIDLLKDHYVVMVTVRRKRHEKSTLARILKKTGWQPDEAFFRDMECSPPEWKQSVLTKLRERFPNSTFMAIESNDKTAAMYVQNGVLTLKVWAGQHRGEAKPKPVEESLF